jgi:hypothetical protein
MSKPATTNTDETENRLEDLRDDYGQELEELANSDHPAAPIAAAVLDDTGGEADE